MLRGTPKKPYFLFLKKKGLELQENNNNKDIIKYIDLLEMDSLKEMKRDVLQKKGASPFFKEFLKDYFPP